MHPTVSGSTVPQSVAQILLVRRLFSPARSRFSVLLGSAILSTAGRRVFVSTETNTSLIYFLKSHSVLGTYRTREIHPRGSMPSAKECGLVCVVTRVPYRTTPERNAKQKKSKSKYLEVT